MAEMFTTLFTFAILIFCIKAICNSYIRKKRIALLKLKEQEQEAEEQQEQFNEINDLRAKDFEESDKNIFVFAFTLAVRLIMECLNKEN